MAQPAPSPLAYSVAETVRVTSLSGSSIYRLIRDGELTARKVGKRTVVLAGSIDRLLARGVERLGDQPTEETVSAERAAQGLPPTVADTDALARVESALRDRTPKAVA